MSTLHVVTDLHERAWMWWKYCEYYYGFDPGEHWRRFHRPYSGIERHYSVYLFKLLLEEFYDAC